MSFMIRSESAGGLWLGLLSHLVCRPEHFSGPRGFRTQEALNVHLELVYPHQNIFVHPVRNLQYRFMVAEWLWIWFGHEDVDSISKYNRHIKQFSDDGTIFTGAYGPRIRAQWPTLLEVLNQDSESRQGVVVIFDRIIRSKDVPCTLTMQFLVREGRLNAIVNMRSSDIWLGLPYDIFNFTMIMLTLAGTFGLDVGRFHMNLGSSHLYQRDLELAERVLEDPVTRDVASPRRLTEEPPAELEKALISDDEIFIIERPWSHYARVLRSWTNKHALEALYELETYAR